MIDINYLVGFEEVCQEILIKWYIWSAVECKIGWFKIVKRNNLRHYCPRYLTLTSLGVNIASYTSRHAREGDCVVIRHPGQALLNRA